MADKNTSLVSAAKPTATGVVRIAPLGTALPTDAKTPLDAAFAKTGYIGEDGVGDAPERETSEQKAFGGDTVTILNTGYKETFKWKFLQSLDVDVLKAVYGTENVTEKAGVITILHNGKDLPRAVFVLELALSGGKIKRLVIPEGQITELSEVSYKDGEVTGYEVTMTTYPDAAGNNVYEYISAAK